MEDRRDSIPHDNIPNLLVKCPCLEEPCVFQNAVRVEPHNQKQSSKRTQQKSACGQDLDIFLRFFYTFEDRDRTPTFGLALRVAFGLFLHRLSFKYLF